VARRSQSDQPLFPGVNGWKSAGIGLPMLDEKQSMGVSFRPRFESVPITRKVEGGALHLSPETTIGDNACARPGVEASP